MNDIAGIPYIEAEFGKDGQEIGKQADLPPGIESVFVISHGWNNDRLEAEGLYRRFFENFRAIDPGDVSGLAVVGVIWPSKKYDESLSVSGAPDAGHGAAGLGFGDAESDRIVLQRLERMKELFTDPDQRRLLDEVEALLPDLDEKASARRAFMERIRALLDPGAATKDDASDSFFKDDGNELMTSLKADADDLDEEIAGRGGASLPGQAADGVAGEGGAAGIVEVLSGFKAAAMNILNYTTYYEMKTRAGTVGKNGVAPLVDRLASRVRAVHLIGHSFGGRVVAAAAAHSHTDRIRSMTLLQAAFSHNGFSKAGFFRDVVDRKRIGGPILITHTPNDKAVGLAYPLASRINGDKAMAFGDKNDVFGAIGRNGAQKMEAGEAVDGPLLAVGGDYAFQPGRFFNLEASRFIRDHSDVTGKEICHAVRKAFLP
ncbi:alpha/beta fold hydrolase [Nitrosovibrio sp. Nv17]|uniref:alpha/beta fold hydrolase n=1 Tax=Nitrosovibrio sp. Nv17 TaxID=1855339 RepID=UPI000908981C|nr:alpha/beta fold hydrolase [Nitrosovibrio sp. Nv17]SFW30529.1 alpha/beta hydrolase fold [Nitrosovibrio sp. Nv17]